MELEQNEEEGFLNNELPHSRDFSRELGDSLLNISANTK